MTKPLPYFFDDAPISTRDDGLMLWRNSPGVLRAIDNISSEIVRQDTGFIYAVYASWGSGKTSIGNIIQREVERRNAEPTDSEANSPVVFSWYQASAYQNVGDVMFTLSLRLLQDLAGNASSVDSIVDTYHRYIHLLTGVPPKSGDKGEVSPRDFKLLEDLARNTGNLVEFNRLLEAQLKGGGPTGAAPRKLVLFVDDLDRCTPEFIAHLLQALRRLSEVKRLFVILLGDRGRILSGVELMYPEVRGNRHQAERALERYVNYAINLPPVDKRLLTQYVERLVDQHIQDSQLTAADPDYRVLQLLRQHAADYLWAAIFRKTPRAIKRAMNAIRPNLQDLEESPFGSANHDMDARYHIKRALLEYSFPEFNGRFVDKAIDDPLSPERGFLFQLETACHSLYGIGRRSTEDEQDRRAILELRIARYRANYLPLKEKDEEIEVSDELAALLATEPLFQRYLTGVWAEEGPTLAPADTRLDRAEEFTRYYLQSEQADARGEADASVRAAANALNLVTNNRKSFSASTAPQLGNLGVNAEKYRQPEIAERIFELAYELDPNHVGVIQQYASFLIDNREEGLGKADELLQRLRQPPYKDQQSSRTLSLLVQLRAKQGQPVDATVVSELVEAAASEPSLRRIGTILTALIQASEVAVALEIYRQAGSRFTQLRECLELNRYVADALAHRKEVEYEYLAMDIYRRMLQHEQVPVTELSDIQHNLATLLYKHDYDADAGRLWFEAYNRRPTDGAIRRAYSSYLMRAAALDEAEQVVNSQPVQEMKLYHTSKVMPERFSDLEIVPCHDGEQSS